MNTKMQKVVNKNVVATISHNEFKEVLLNNKCRRHSMNRTQIRDHNDIHFDDKIYTENMDMPDWVLDVRVNYKKAVLLIFF